jgi:Fe-S cluster biogenesis protein NfuA
MRKIREVLAQKVLPVLQIHNCGIELVEVTPTRGVKVKLTGACAACPGAQQTIKEIVETALEEACPEIKGVVIMHQVSIRFCGGCNPRIDRSQIAEKVREAMAAYGYNVVFNSVNADFIVYLSGCTASCAYRYSSSKKPCVVVAAATIDMLPVDEKDLGLLISQKVRGYFEQLARPLPQ